ncbi:MAG: hypothetical protein C4329_10125 [Chitinophagaceae bacterium]
MKDKIINPVSTNEDVQKGLASVNTWNSEEIDNTKSEHSGEPKNFEREEEGTSDNNNKKA